MGLSCRESGWNVLPGEFDNLPICFRADKDKEPIALPSGELWLTDPVTRASSTARIYTGRSVKSQSAIRVGSFCGVHGDAVHGAVAISKLTRSPRPAGRLKTVSLIHSNAEPNFGVKYIGSLPGFALRRKRCPLASSVTWICFLLSPEIKIFRCCCISDPGLR